MGAQGTTTVNFGAFPGAYEASAVVTGQASIVAGSLVEAWVRPEATADHSADEHMIERLRVIATDIVAGTGFTVRAWNETPAEPLAPPGIGRRHVAHATAGNNFKGPGDQNPSVGGRVPPLYGQFTVAWVWN